MQCGPDGCPILAFSDLTAAEQRVERGRIAAKMFAQGFTEQQIAKQLGVGQATIARDLASLSDVNKPPRPKGGRPKGSKSVRKKRETPVLDKARDIVRPLVNDNQPTNSRTLERAHGISHVHFETATAVERALKEQPPIDVSTLSASAQKKLAAAIRQEKRRLAAEFETAVQSGIRQRLDEIVLPNWKKQIAEAKVLYDRRRGLMSKDTFNTIRRALHPDSRNAISDRKLGEAFDAFMGLEKFLLNEADSPTEFGDLPATAAEWDKMRAKAKRTSGPNGMRRR